MAGKYSVLFLVNRFDMGGVQRASITMLNMINKSEFDVHLLYHDEGILFSEINVSGITVSKLKGKSCGYNPVFLVIDAIQVYRYVLKHKISLIHSMQINMYIAGSIVAHFMKIVHVRTQPNFIRRHEKKNAKTLKILPFERWTDRFITYNDASAEDLHQAGVNKDKICVIKGFTGKEAYENIEIDSDIRQEFNIPVCNKIILAMHRMVKRKGFEIFVDMIPLIISKYPAVTFLMVGDGPIKAELEDKVAKLGIVDHVRFTGFRTDRDSIVKQITFAVYPTADTAAMGYVIRAGKVLITKKNSSMDEYVLDSQTGYLVENDTAEKYAEKALMLLEDDLLLKSFEENQSKFVDEHLNGKDDMKKLEEMFISLCNIKMHQGKQ